MNISMPVRSHPGNMRLYTFSGIVSSAGMVIASDVRHATFVPPVRGTTPTKMSFSEIPIFWEIRNISSSGILRFGFADAFSLAAPALMAAAVGGVLAAGTLIQPTRLNPGEGWSDFPRPASLMMGQDGTVGTFAVCDERSGLSLTAETTDIEFTGTVLCAVVD